jgi:hypothetical protein
MDRWLSVPCVVLLACTPKEPPPSKAGPAVAPSTRSSASASTRASPAAVRAEPPGPAPTSVKVEFPTDGGLPGLRLGQLFDIGPAGPATATSTGIVFLTRKDQVLKVPLTGPDPVRAKLGSVAAEPPELAPLGRAPAVAGGMVYWVSRGRLVRRSLAGESEVEVLRDDARETCRTSAVELGGATFVSYLGKPDAEGTSHARLWSTNGPPLDLTPEGAGASSTALAALEPNRLLAVSIDGRSAMTPLHARTLELIDGRAKLTDDVVVWVGGPAQSYTEVTAGASGGVGWAAVPLERDATHFGLATLELGAKPRLDTEVSFFDYPNGLDLAPVALAELCGRAVLAFVRPVLAAPRSPAELVLSDPSSGRTLRVAEARGFAGVSVSQAAGGGLIAYVADGRTWAAGIGCD